ncbi:MAG: hypothetical protein ACR2PO_04815, partial [Methyloligellaceae bacterium]
PTGRIPCPFEYFNVGALGDFGGCSGLAGCVWPTQFFCPHRIRWLATTEPHWSRKHLKTAFVNESAAILAQL